MKLLKILPGKRKLKKFTEYVEKVKYPAYFGVLREKSRNTHLFNKIYWPFRGFNITKIPKNFSQILEHSLEWSISKGLSDAMLFHDELLKLFQHHSAKSTFSIQQRNLKIELIMEELKRRNIINFDDNTSKYPNNLTLQDKESFEQFIENEFKDLLPKSLVKTFKMLKTSYLNIQDTQEDYFKKAKLLTRHLLQTDHPNIMINSLDKIQTQSLELLSQILCNYKRDDYNHVYKLIKSLLHPQISMSVDEIFRIKSDNFRKNKIEGIIKNSFNCDNIHSESHLERVDELTSCILHFENSQNQTKQELENLIIEFFIKKLMNYFNYKKEDQEVKFPLDLLNVYVGIESIAFNLEEFEIEKSKKLNTILLETLKRFDTYLSNSETTLDENKVLQEIKKAFAKTYKNEFIKLIQDPKNIAREKLETSVGFAWLTSFQFSKIPSPISQFKKPDFTVGMKLDQLFSHTDTASDANLYAITKSMDFIFVYDDYAEEQTNPAYLNYLVDILKNVMNYAIENLPYLPPTISQDKVIELLTENSSQQLTSNNKEIQNINLGNQDNENKINLDEDSIAQLINELTDKATIFGESLYDVVKEISEISNRLASKETNEIVGKIEFVNEMSAYLDATVQECIENTQIPTTHKSESNTEDEKQYKLNAFYDLRSRTSGCSVFLVTSIMASEIPVSKKDYLNFLNTKIPYYMNMFTSRTNGLFSGVKEFLSFNWKHNDIAIIKKIFNYDKQKAVEVLYKLINNDMKNLTSLTEKCFNELEEDYTKSKSVLVCLAATYQWVFGGLIAQAKAKRYKTMDQRFIENKSELMKIKKDNAGILYLSPNTLKEFTDKLILLKSNIFELIKAGTTISENDLNKELNIHEPIIIEHIKLSSKINNIFSISKAMHLLRACILKFQKYEINLTSIKNFILEFEYGVQIKYIGVINNFLSRNDSLTHKVEFFNKGFYCNFKGKMYDGYFHGMGTLSTDYFDTNEYNGMFYKNLYHGYGRYIKENLPEYTEKYEGEFFEGLYHGNGKLIKEQNYDEDFREDTNVIAIGHFKKGKLNGFGILEQINQQKQIGFFKDNKIIPLLTM